MNNVNATELASNAEQHFQAALGHGFRAVSRELLAPSSFRGGFRLVFVRASVEIVVSYGGMEFEVACNGHEIFGHTTHAGFEGNMFSQEHLKQYLPRIAARSGPGKLNSPVSG